MPKSLKTFRISDNIVEPMLEYAKVHNVPVSSLVESAISRCIDLGEFHDRNPDMELVCIPVKKELVTLLKHYRNYEELSQYLEAKLKQAHKEETEADSEKPFEQLSQEEQLKRFNF